MNKYTTKQKALFAAFCARHEITFNTMGEYYSALDTYFIDWYNKGLENDSHAVLISVYLSGDIRYRQTDLTFL